MPRLILYAVSRFVLALALLLPAAWLTTAPALAQYHFYYGRNKIQYEGFDWHVLRTDHFDIYYYPEMQALAENGAHFAEEAYGELENKFDFSLNHRVPLIFYSSNLHFKQTNITPGFIPDGVGGFFEFLKGRVVIPANGNIHRFRRVIRHELVHVFTYSKLTRVMRDHRRPLDGVPPLWFTEGLAEYWSGEPDFQHEMVLRDAVASNYFVPLENLDRIYGTYLMYKEGEAACRFIAETYGEEKLLRLLEEFWRDPDFRKVMEAVLREDYRDVSDRWTAWVHAQYLPKLDEAQPPTLMSEAVTARGFSGKPAFYQHADGRREIAFVGNRDGYTNLYAVEVDAAGEPMDEPRVLVKGERSGRFEAFHFFESRMDVSADGKLAFVTQSGEADVIHVYDLAADAMGPTYRFDDLIAVYSPSWDPTGTKLAFTSIDMSGFADLYTYDTRVDGAPGALRKLTNDPYDDRDPAWSPDGRFLAFSSDRTDFGKDGSYNIFTLTLDTGEIDYVTYGEQVDLSPHWSPDGDRLVFISSRRGEDGKFSGQDLWVADMQRKPGEPTEVALVDAGEPFAVPETARAITQLTAFTGAAFDPVWTEDDRLLFATIEDSRFTIRRASADSLLQSPRTRTVVGLGTRAEAEPWAYERLRVQDEERRQPYRKTYSLDVAQGALSTNPVWGTNGGAVLAFSDLLGNDQIFVSAYTTRVPGRSFVDGINASVTRIHLGRRANYGYGAYRYSGQRYDLTDPDAADELLVEHGVDLVQLQPEGDLHPRHRPRGVPPLERRRAHARQRALRLQRPHRRVEGERDGGVHHRRPLLERELLHPDRRRPPLPPHPPRRDVRLVGARADERRARGAAVPPRRELGPPWLPALPRPRPPHVVHVAGAPLPDPRTPERLHPAPRPVRHREPPRRPLRRRRPRLERRLRPPPAPALRRHRPRRRRLRPADEPLRRLRPPLRHRLPLRRRPPVVRARPVLLVLLRLQLLTRVPMTGERRRTLWSQPTRSLAALLLVSSLLAGCSVFQLGAPLRVQEGDWTTEGGSAARTNATERTLHPPLEEAWTYDADGAFGPAAAVVADDVVIVVTRKGEVRAVGLEDGRKRSIGEFREPIEGAPVVTRRMLYTTVAAGKRTIIAHDFVDGRRVWSLRAGPHDAGLLLSDSTLVAAGRDGAVRAIDPLSGSIRWQVTPDSAAGFFATPVALRDAARSTSSLIAVADDRGRVTALDLATGTTRWTRSLGLPVYDTPAVRDGRLFVPTTRGRFVALDAASGEPVWTVEAGEAVRFSAPAVDAGLVVVGASDGRLRALDAATGEPVWTFLADGNFAAAPLLAGDVVYAGALDEHIYAFDRATGDVLWQHELGGRIKSTPIVHGGRLIVLAEPRHIHAFEAASPVAASTE